VLWSKNIKEIWYIFDMKKIEIDVVLLVSEETAEKSIELNREIIKKDDRVILDIVL